ncbi:unnamed protein product [Amaranthus hypochondriacus]
MKSKVKTLKKIKLVSSLKKKKNYYFKMEKSGSVKLAFRRKKTRKLFDDTFEANHDPT